MNISTYHYNINHHKTNHGMSVHNITVYYPTNHRQHIARNLTDLSATSSICSSMPLTPKSAFGGVASPPSSPSPSFARCQAATTWP
jgi:hypothetical protein